MPDEQARLEVEGGVPRAVTPVIPRPPDPRFAGRLALLLISAAVLMPWLSLVYDTVHTVWATPALLLLALGLLSWLGEHHADVALWYTLAAMALLLAGTVGAFLLAGAAWLHGTYKGRPAGAA